MTEIKKEVVITLWGLQKNRLHCISKFYGSLYINYLRAHRLAIITRYHKSYDNFFSFYFNLLARLLFVARLFLQIVEKRFSYSSVFMRNIFKNVLAADCSNDKPIIFLIFCLFKAFVGLFTYFLIKKPHPSFQIFNFKKMGSGALSGTRRVRKENDQGPPQIIFNNPYKQHFTRKCTRSKHNKKKTDHQLKSET